MVPASPIIALPNLVYVDLKVQLNGTEYGSLTHSLPSPMTTGMLGTCLRDKYVEEFKYLQENATGTLSRFLDYITYEYQIDNVITIITGMLHESASAEELASRCHPLGLFEALPALTVARDISELYNTVLVETPLAPYFRECMRAAGGKDLDEFNLEIIRNTLHRAYLEDFHRFCRDECDELTGKVMAGLLSFEADRRILNVCINSLGLDMAREAKLALLPKFGILWESGVAMKLTLAHDMNQIKNIIDTDCPIYHQILEVATRSSYANGKGKEVILHPPYASDNANGDSDRTMEEYFFEKEVSLCKDAMMYQFSFAPFYSFVKLKEQEGRNLVWIAECIAQRQKENIHHYIPIFS